MVTFRWSGATEQTVAALASNSAAQVLGEPLAADFCPDLWLALHCFLTACRRLKQQACQKGCPSCYNDVHSFRPCSCLCWCCTPD
jgi:hypothetical protein